MSDLSPRLNMPLIMPSQAQKHVTHNEALVILDALVQSGIAAFDATTPPGDPAEGALYALGSTPTGDWAGAANQLALRQGSGWRFLTPQAGWRAWDLGAGRLMVFDGSAWSPLAGDIETVETLGINTGADTTNRLAVAAEASLLSHSGAGHQLKINKAGAGETASLLFQSNWTGHAEMGLAGTTGFSIKVSPDGTSWTDALAFDPVTGLATGAALQQSATDTGAGRLMRADWGYGPGNLLGSVSQSAGTPTGAVIERGRSGDGDYVRFADGTQIAWIRDDLTRSSNARLSFDWTYPAAFSSTPAVTATLAADSGTTPGPDQMHGPFALAETATCSLRLYRSNGAANFTSGETLAFQATAIGRWY